MRYSSINTAVHCSTYLCISDCTKKETNQGNILCTKSPVHNLYIKNSIRNGNTEHGKGIHGTVKLKWILNKLDEARTGPSWLRIGTGGGNRRMR